MCCTLLSAKYSFSFGSNRASKSIMVCIVFNAITVLTVLFTFSILKYCALKSLRKKRCCLSIKTYVVAVLGQILPLSSTCVSYSLMAEWPRLIVSLYFTAQAMKELLVAIFFNTAQIQNVLSAWFSHIWGVQLSRFCLQAPTVSDFENSCHREQV